mgnify:FL=1
MTRRSALVATALMTAASLGEMKSQGQTSLTFRIADSITPLTFDLAGFTSYTFTLGQEFVTFTPADVMAALKPCQHEAQAWSSTSSAGLLSFVVNGRTLDICRKCGTTYWRDSA